MHLRRLLVALGLSLLFVFAPATSSLIETPIVAAQTKTIHVKQYTRKDGTVVKAHERAAPRTHSTTASRVAAIKPATPQRIPTATLARDERGRIQRSAAARHAFARQTGYPKGRPGWIIDHIVPLACGGADAPSNMQWQTVKEAKAKDRVERTGC